MGRTQRHRAKQPKPADIKPLQCLSSLYKFLHSKGWQNETQLSALNFAATGRGLCSKTQSFDAQQELIRLPLDCLLHIGTLEHDASFKLLFNTANFSEDCKISFQSLMAVYLLHLKHQTADLAHQAYINSIPTQFSMPYFCTLPELQCLPESLLLHTVEQNRKIRHNYNMLSNVFTSDSCSCCGKTYFTELFTLAEFKWAYFAINSRSVYVHSGQIKCCLQLEGFYDKLLSDASNLALAPFLDLFNHSDKVETNADLLRAGNDQLHYVLTLQSAEELPIKPYRQLFISYGALPNFKLLSEYGFVLSNNKHDFFELSLADIEQFIQADMHWRRHNFHSNKFKFIREHNLHDQMFVHLEQGISHNLQVVLHLLFKEPSHFVNLLNQVAYGAAELLQNIDDIAEALLLHKVNEYQQYLKLLQKQAYLSQSGCQVMEYMLQAIEYLNSFIEINFK